MSRLMHVPSGSGASIDGARVARRRLSAAVGLMVTAALIWWTLRDVPLATLLAHLRDTDAGLLAAAAAIAIVTVLLRVPRWRCALWQHAGVSSRALYHAIVLGLLGNNVLPARTGEVVRAYALGRLAPVRTGTALGSIALERVLDVLAIAILVLVGVAVEGNGSGARSALPVAHVAGLAGSVIVLIVGAGLLLSWRPRQVVGGVHSVIRRLLPARWTDRLAELIERVAAGFAAARSPRRVLELLAWSILVWSVNAIAFWVGFAAFGIQVPWSAAVVVQGTVTLGIALPSSPGFFGPFEAATRIALTSYGVAPAAAAAFAVPFHLVAFFFPTIALGAWSLWTTGVSIGRGTVTPPRPREAEDRSLQDEPRPAHSDDWSPQGWGSQATSSPGH